MYWWLEGRWRHSNLWLQLIRCCRAIDNTKLHSSCPNPCKCQLHKFLDLKLHKSSKWYKILNHEEWKPNLSYLQHLRWYVPRHRPSCPLGPTIVNSQGWCWQKLLVEDDIWQKEKRHIHFGSQPHWWTRNGQSLQRRDSLIIRAIEFQIRCYVHGGCLLYRWLDCGNLGCFRREDYSRHRWSWSTYHVQRLVPRDLPCPLLVRTAYPWYSIHLWQKGQPLPLQSRSRSSLPRPIWRLPDDGHTCIHEGWHWVCSVYSHLLQHHLVVR